MTDYGKIDKVVTMFNDLFGKERFETATLVGELLKKISLMINYPNFRPSSS